jgi:pilus assembly protein CpaB
MCNSHTHPPPRPPPRAAPPPPPPPDPKAERQILLEVANRPIDTGTTYTVGADVSRFQRSTVPSKSSSPSNTDPSVAMANAISSLAGAAGGKPASGETVVRGPSVRVARGNTVTLVPVGAK